MRGRTLRLPREPDGLRRLGDTVGRGGHGLNRDLTCGGRGDHRPASDYDIAVFIKDPGTLRDEVHRLASEVILPDLFDGPINITYL